MGKKLDTRFVRSFLYFLLFNSMHGQWHKKFYVEFLEFSYDLLINNLKIFVNIFEREFLKKCSYNW